MTLRWQGKGVDEKAWWTDADAPAAAREHPIVAVDPRYFRPAEVETLLGDATRARQKLGWAPKISFAQLVEEMVREDLASAQRDQLVKKHGYRTMDNHE